jgi:glycosyltransferase involved in cell wall biosynthesis/peptidoglycan/xylan/chitin deacetylase (PgdA/CDA1 family)
MRIVIVTSEFGENSGGLSWSCTNFARMLENLGHSVFIVSSINENNIVEYDNVVKNKVKFSAGGYKKRLKDHLFFRAHSRNVKESIKNANIDCIIAFGAGLNGLFAADISAQTNIKLIVLLRGSEINLSISDFELREANFYCLKKASMVIALSNELLERAKELYFNAKIAYKVIPNIVTPALGLITPDLNKNKILLGCGSYHLNEKKGVSNLIAMVSYLNKLSEKCFKIEFIGKVDDDLLQNYHALCKQYNIVDEVQFVGKQERSEFIDRMKNWDFYVQGSFCEGFANSVADYLSLGKAFVLSDSGFIAEIIKEECPELVFDNFVPENMAQKVFELSNNTHLKDITDRAYRLINIRTNKEKITTQWENVFSSFHINTAMIDNKLNNNILSVVLHDIDLETYSNIDTPINVFADFVKDVAHKGYRLCSVEQYFTSEDMSNLIICTFDDAYSSVVEYALPVLKQYGFTATIFVCYNYIGQNNDWNMKDTKKRKHLTEDELLLLQSEGWEIGSHGLTHNSLLRLTESELTSELSDSKKLLSNMFGTIESYAYPYGDYNEYCKSKASKTYKCSFSLTKGGTLRDVDNWQIRRYFISELNSLLR